MHRDKSIVVWIPHEKAYVVVDAKEIRTYRDSFRFGIERFLVTQELGSSDIREYVAVSALGDYEEIRIVDDIANPV